MRHLLPPTFFPCQHARARLVALSDGELPQGEAHRVRAHLARCPACTAHARRLDHATPRRSSPPPSHWSHKARQAMLDGIDAGAAQPPDVATTQASSSRWNGLLAAAFVVLAAWGAAGWLRPLQPDALGDPQGDAPQAAATSVPAEHVQPASYAPDDGWF